MAEDLAVIGHAVGFNFDTLSEAESVKGSLDNAQGAAEGALSSRARQVIATIRGIRREDSRATVELIGQTTMIDSIDVRLGEQALTLSFIRVITGLSDSAVRHMYDSNQTQEEQ